MELDTLFKILTENFGQIFTDNEIIAHTETIQFQIIAMKESAKVIFGCWSVIGIMILIMIIEWLVK
jgi:hypothetical protein